MGFVAISIDDYIKKHLKNNPDEDAASLRKKLNAALENYRKGEKCSCGNDIWVIGSAFVGNMCLTCLTGEGYPENEYEIDKAINKNRGVNINEKDITKIAGFFDDDGFEIDMKRIKKPSLCLSCKKNDKPEEELLCNMIRYDQMEEKEFHCNAYEPRKK